MKTLKTLISLVVTFILGTLAGWQFANSQPVVKAARSVQKSSHFTDAQMIELFSSLGKIMQNVGPNFFSQKQPGPKDLPAARYDWLPGSATDFLGRMSSSTFNGDGPELATFRCNPADLAALMTRFKGESPGSQWVSDRPDRARLIVDELKSLKFPENALPSEKSQSFEFLMQPEPNSLFGPHILVDTKEGRVWYLIIRN